MWYYGQQGCWPAAQHYGKEGQQLQTSHGIKTETYFSSTLLWASVLTPAGNMAVRGVLTSVTVDRAFFFDSRFLADVSEARLDLEELARPRRFVEDAALPDLAEANLGGLARKILMRSSLALKRPVLHCC